MVIVKTENRISHNTQKTSPQSYKTQIKILPFPGLALSSSEHSGARSYALRLAQSYILRGCPNEQNVAHQTREQK